MTDHHDIVERLASTAVVIGNLPELPGYNGSVLTIDDEEAARCAADIDAGIAEITRLRVEAEALRKDAEMYRLIAQSKAGTIRLDGDPADKSDYRWASPQYIHWGGELTLDAAIAATKEQQA